MKVFSVDKLGETMKVILVLLFFVLMLKSEELILDDLLHQYAESESLYHKTKQESSGFLIVYSREDLERMQAYTLKDVLKTVRAFNLLTSKIGQYPLVQSGAGASSVSPIKLYIDDHELAVVMGATPLKIYANMDLYFIDHIEIYQGGSSIAFGNEPGSMVIRLYTKDPEREDSSSAQFSVDSFGGGSLRGIDTGVTGEYKYLLYANAASDRFETHTRDAYELSRDGTRYQAYFNFSQEDNFNLQANYFTSTTDIFNGIGLAPSGGDTNPYQGYVSVTKYFDDDWKLYLSYSTENHELKNHDDKGVMLADGTLSNYLHLDLDNDIYKASIEKKIVDGASDLLLGVQWQQKNLKINSYQSNGVEHPMKWGPDKLDIYMAYVEELYNINEDHLLAFSAKVDHYKNNFSKSSNEYALRAGYTAVFDKAWTTKLFAIRRYQYPNAVQTSFAPNYNPNPELRSAKVNMLAGEVTYTNDSDTVTFSYAHRHIDDAVIFNSVAKKYVNKGERAHFGRFFIREEHRFDYDNKIIVEFFKVNKEKYVSSGSGALIQMFNRIGEVDIYNELVYRDDYSVNGVDIDAGYDYSLGLIYSVNRQLTIKCKGENLLDKASEVPIGTLELPTVDRRFSATMEYMF